MLERIVLGLTVAFWIAGIVSLILARLILDKFIRWVSTGSQPIQLGLEDEAQSELISGFASTSRSTSMASTIAAPEELKVIPQAR